MKPILYTKFLLASTLVLILNDCGGSSSHTLTSKEKALNHIEAYAQSGGTAPTVQEYTNAGVTGVNADNLDEINEIVENLTGEEVDTTEEIQTLVNGTAPVVISHHGVNYRVVVSPITGRTWLDRNIGAKKVCTTPYDTACYGDYYQWGRNTDGHEKIHSKTTKKKGKTITDSGDKFVINDDGDWTTSTHRGENWRATDGRSVCPAGFRVPNKNEFQAEMVNIESKKDIYKNFLKMPFAGYRSMSSGKIEDSEEAFTYWINGVPADENYLSYALIANNYNRLEVYVYKNSRAYGNSIRCIKN